MSVHKIQKTTTRAHLSFCRWLPFELDRVLLLHFLLVIVQSSWPFSLLLQLLQLLDLIQLSRATLEVAVQMLFQELFELFRRLL